VVGIEERIRGLIVRSRIAGRYHEDAIQQWAVAARRRGPSYVDAWEWNIAHPDGPHRNPDD
jgi:hypothetical protein